MKEQSARKTLRMPITNIYAKGGFSVSVKIGSELKPVNLVLDTGSSTLVVTSEAYFSAKDTSLQATSYAQSVSYGMGGWYGSVVKTDVDMLAYGESLFLAETHISIAEVSKPGCFAKADGILGLAFHELNRCHNLTEYLVDKNIFPEATHPWQPDDFDKGSIKDFKKFLKAYPKEDIKPYFTQLEDNGVSPNKFSFLSRRSSIHHHSPGLSQEQLKQDPLNQGLFILGGGVEDTDLYHGELQRIKVIDDVYYNVRLLKVKVGDCEPFEVPKLIGKEQERHHSNAFVDTGASLLVLESSVFNYIIDCFEKTNPEFKTILEPFLSFEGVEEGVPLEKLNLAEWPELEFVFEASVDSKSDEVSWICRADDYWQVNAPEHGQASFKILSQLPGWPDQSIIGLPLLTDYYVVFARFENEFGDIKFAPVKLK